MSGRFSEKSTNGRNYRAKRHWSGWEESEELKKQQLPAKVKCGRCFKVKPCNESHFSKKQLMEVKRHIIDNEGIMAGLLTIDKFTCWTCSPNQTMELCCSVCDKYKSLDEFAKTQRRTPDCARCRSCWAKHESLGPEGAEPMLDFDDDTDSDDDEWNEQTTSGASVEGDMDNRSTVGSIATTSGGVPLLSSVRGSEAGWTERKGSGFATPIAVSQAHRNDRPTPSSFNPYAYGTSKRADSVKTGASIKGLPSAAGGSSERRGWAKPYNPNSNRTIDLDILSLSIDVDDEDQDDDDFNDNGAGFAKKEKKDNDAGSESSDDGYY